MTTIFSSPSLRLSLRLLAHPLTLAALALLAANDLIFRRLWPSWWTGKIGDAAWLVAAPWIVAVVLAFGFSLITTLLRSWKQQPAPPLAAKHQGDRSDSLAASLPLLAILLTGLAFSLVKTVPSLHTMATRILPRFLGAAPSLVFDPTDLLALPALFLPLALLRRARIQQAYSTRSAPRHGRPLWHWAALPLAAFVLLADAAAPDRGFLCFEERGGALFAPTGYALYRSDDGGLTWKYADSGGPNCSAQAQPALLDGWQQVGGPSEGVEYRYRPGVEIQISRDGGQTWATAYTLQGISEPEQMFILKTREGNPIYEPGPLAAMALPEEGRMLFAMGQEGVLVHTAQDEWLWTYGGAYGRAEAFPNGAALAALLGPVIYMAVLLALLVYASLALAYTGGWLRSVVLALGWLGWLLVGIIFPPPSSFGYAEIFTVFGILLVGILLIPLVIEQTFKLVRLGSKTGPKPIARMALIALAGGLLYFIPFLLWLYGILPTLNIAIIAGLVIAAALVGAGFTLTRAERAPRA